MMDYWQFAAALYRLNPGKESKLQSLKWPLVGVFIFRNMYQY